jgi:hypothetical protein
MSMASQSPRPAGGNQFGDAESDLPALGAALWRNKLVRLIEFALVGLVGLIVYFSYVVPTDGFAWHYIAAILGIELLALLAFQVADIYQVQPSAGMKSNTCGSPRPGRSCF